MFKIHFLAILTVLCFAPCLVAEEQPDIEVYGKLPEIRAVSISPDGKHYAYIRRIDDIDYFVVENTETREIVGGGDTSKFKARSTAFATNNYVLLRGSDTRKGIGYRGKFEMSGALAFSIKDKKFKTLLKGTYNLHPAQSNTGRIVGLHKNGEIAYMPAYEYDNDPSYSLYKVKLKTGKGRIHERGKKHTRDWFVDENGAVLAREDYRENDQQHQVYSKTSGKWRLIYSLDTDYPNISIQAIDSDNKALLFVDEKEDHEAVYRMSLDDGEITGPLFEESERDIDFLETDINRNLTAVVYSGFISDYEFINQTDQSLYNRLVVTFPKSNIHYLSVADDRSKIIFQVSGMEGAGSYMLFDTKNPNIYGLSEGYKVPEVAELKAVKYKARDGLKIPSIITFPLNVDERVNLPLIALPHGGPHAYDSITFDWMAQYFAAKGYMVLQPNFRGSTGFGYSFRNAGFAKWGREMQDDVTDGIKTLIDAGYVDPGRVCIVGASYGGYSALAGGAFDSDIYRCVISLNGVSDLPLMLSAAKYKYGRNHWVAGYWKKVADRSKEAWRSVEEISPINFAENFQAPVLLLHGVDDTVVPIEQSKRMSKRLKKAGKDVDLIKLKGEDHWLSTSSARLEALQAMSDFLDLHNPAN